MLLSDHQVGVYNPLLVDSAGIVCWRQWSPHSESPACGCACPCPAYARGPPAAAHSDGGAGAPSTPCRLSPPPVLGLQRPPAPPK